jgi:hypothetical protein
MNAVGRSLAVLAGLGVLVGGCAAASHLSQLQPPAVGQVATITLPVAYQHGTFQRGIDVDWYTYSGQNVSADAAATVTYIQSLHANAVSVSFPFFTKGQSPGSVHGASTTPTPDQLGILVSDAREAGLYVSLRPLLSEPSLGLSRVRWIPSDPRAFFAAYLRFLIPYLRMAQRDQVPEFIIGAEFEAFGTAPGWRAVDREARRLFHGTLACADNWPTVQRDGCGTPVQTVDAYRPLHARDWLAGWERWDHSLPTGIVQTEVGIAAAPQAAQRPYRVRWPIAVTDPAVQARWFASACQAAVNEHLGGIYFWSVSMAATQPKGPTPESQTTWAGGPAAGAISACFASIEGAGR